MIRNANITDLAFINKSHHEMISEYGKYCVLIDTSEHVDYTPSDLAAPDTFYYIACDEEDITHRKGYIKFSLRTHGLTKIIYIHQLFVTEDKRRKGVGTELLNKALSIGQSLGCNQLQLQVVDGNSIARQFYQKNGMLDVKHTVGKTI